MRLRSITLANFRGFADRQTVPLDGDIVVVWGANGTGKTSLFDGLQWALVGSVPRLAAASLRKSEDPVASRYATGVPFASVELQDAAGVWTVNRTGRESSKSRVTVAEPDGRIREDEDAEEFVRNLIGHEDLSLRTYLLQQDEVTELLSGDTRERYRFVADLTGLEGLRSLDEQLRSELRRHRAAVRTRQEDLETQRERVAADQRELEETRALIDRQRAERQERYIEATRLLAERLDIPPSDPDEAEVAIRAVLAEGQRLLGVLAAEPESRATERLPSEPSDLQSAVEAAARTLQLIEERQANLSSEIARMQELITDQRRQRDDLQQLAALALDRLGPPCPVCGQDHDVDRTRARLTAVLDAEDDSAVFTGRLGELEAEYADLRQKRRDVESELEAAHLRRRLWEADKNALEEHRSAASRAQTALEALLRVELPAGGETQAAAERISELEERLAAVQNARRDLAQLRAIETRAAGFEEDLVPRVSRLEATQSEIVRLEDRHARAEAVCRWVGSQAEAISADIMDRAAPLADALFRRFDVHPTFRRFAFRPDRLRETGHLRPWVFDDAGKEDGNAAQVLSAAQLNALAVSLFLSLNLEERSGLGVALLDDPVQNMDDLNVLSLIDVLRALRTRRQIVLTTHDVVLAQLLQSKLRPLAQSERTLLVKLSRWTPRGPAIEVESRGWEPGSAGYELVTGGNGGGQFEVH